MGIFDTMMGLFEEYEKCYIIAQELQILKILVAAFPGVFQED